MAIVLMISGRQPVEFAADSITLGSDPAGAIALTGDDRIKPRHAVIRLVAGRWLVEAREGESIQVGNSEPARVHWLNAGDVIRLVENGPEITFQPPRQESVAATAPLVPAAAAPREPSIPLGVQIGASIGGPIGAPARTALPDLPPMFDSLFTPIAKPAVTPMEPPQPPRERESAAVPPSRQREPQRGRENSPRARKIKPVEIAGVNPEPVPQEPSVRVLPRLQGEDTEYSRSSTNPDSLGWVVIWVLVGLGVLLIGTIIWFVSFPSTAETNDLRPPDPAGRVFENQGPR